jgi:hypothetical protein
VDLEESEFLLFMSLFFLCSCLYLIWYFYAFLLFLCCVFSTWHAQCCYYLKRSRVDRPNVDQLAL